MRFLLLDVLARRIPYLQASSDRYSGRESFIHICQDCPSLSQIRSNFNLSQVLAIAGSSFKFWFENLLEVLPLSEVVKVIVICYNLRFGETNESLNCRTKLLPVS